MSGRIERRQTIRTSARWLLGLAYLVAGVLHLVEPAPFLAITPRWVPNADSIVLMTGIAEIAGSLALLQALSLPLRRFAGIALAMYALCVWPANINHFALDMTRADNGLGLAYHIPRMFAQPVIIWLALWTGQATDWPFGRSTKI